MNVDQSTLVAVAGTVAGQAVSMAREFLPDVSEMIKADPAHHTDFVSAVRAGQLTTVLGVAAVAGTAAVMTGSPKPLLVGAACVGLMLIAYEYLLRRSAPTTTPAAP